MSETFFNNPCKVFGTFLLVLRHLNDEPQE